MLSSKRICGFLFFPIILFILLQSSSLTNIIQIKSLRLFIAIVVPFIVTYRARQQNTLNTGGIIVAFILGVLVTAVNGIYCGCLLAFFWSGSKATRMHDHFISKKNKTEKFNKTSRTWIQVLCNGGSVAILSAIQLATLGIGEYPVAFQPIYKHASFGTMFKPHLNSHLMLGSVIHIGVLGILSCCAGDTLASELSPIYSQHLPVLITHPWRHVPIGTNGGITLIGILFSGIGGLLIGLVDFSLTLFFSVYQQQSQIISLFELAISQFPLIILSIMSGIIGSTIDSFVGALLQFSGIDPSTGTITDIPSLKIQYISGISILDNHLVNFLSSTLTGLICVIFCYTYLL